MWISRLASALMLLAALSFAPRNVQADEPTGLPSKPPEPDPKDISGAKPDQAPPIPEAASPEAPPAGIAPPVNPTPQAPPPSEVARPEKGAPRLHIEADRPGVRLFRIERAISNDMGEGLLIRTACAAPCDKVVDGRKGQTFFFGAEGMVPSRGFLLQPISGDVTARIFGGSFIARQVGFLLAGFGGAGALGGGIMLGVGYNAKGTLSSGGKVQDGQNSALTTGGFIALGVGAAMVATGITLVLTNKTRISLVQASPTSAGVWLEGGTLVF